MKLRMKDSGYQRNVDVFEFRGGLPSKSAELSCESLHPGKPHWRNHKGSAVVVLFESKAIVKAGFHGKPKYARLTTEIAFPPVLTSKVFGFFPSVKEGFNGNIEV